MGLVMKQLLDEIRDKWIDVRSSTDDVTEQTLCDEFLDDLKELNKWLQRS